MSHRMTPSLRDETSRNSVKLRRQHLSRCSGTAEAQTSHTPTFLPRSRSLRPTPRRVREQQAAGERGEAAPSWRRRPLSLSPFSPDFSSDEESSYGLPLRATRSRSTGSHGAERKTPRYSPQRSAASVPLPRTAAAAAAQPPQLHHNTVPVGQGGHAGSGNVRLPLKK